jgi:Tol biopolymer transport system component
MITSGKGSAAPFVFRLIFPLIAILAAQGADAPKETVSRQPAVKSVTQVTRDGVSKTNLLADESNLYVTEWPAARHVVAKVSLADAHRSVISTAFPNVQALDISADGSKLLVSPIQTGGDAEFWTLPINAGVPRRVGDLTGRDAAWSADGKYLVFSKGAKVYVASADGTSAREVYTADGTVFAPRFSPDGKRIRFTVGNTAHNANTIWEVGQDGSKPHSVLGDWQGGSASCCGLWTADGRYYIFQVTQSAPTAVTTLWALLDSAPMGKPAQLTYGPMSFGNASLARDSSKIWAIGVKPAGEAVKYDAATKSFVPLLASVSATDLDYSADGQWVAYVSVPDFTLWRCRADGSERLQLTSSPERVALPRWSRDGNRIAYVSLQPGKLSKISVISREGGAPEDILKENRGQIDANWSADGRRIMFGYLYDTAGLDIRVIDLKTGEVVTVPGSQGLFSPRWSPNERYIAALSPDFTKVMLYDFQTKKWTTWLTEPAGAVSYPSWSADSRYLYFDDLVTDEESIRRVKVGQNQAERVFKLEGIERYPGPFGLWSGRTNNGSWMFVRDRSTQEVYQLAVDLP